MDQTWTKYDISMKDLGFSGLDDFKGGEDIVASEGRLRRLKFLVVSPDQEGAGFSAHFALNFYFGVLCWTIWDEMHRVHNDIFAAVRAANLRPQVMLCTILLNLSWGPWASCSWYTRLQEEASAYFSSATHEDPLFRHLVARIKMDDPDFCEALDTDAASEEVFNSLCESGSLLRKGKKVHMSRWGSWLQCMAQWAPLRNRRTLLLLVYGLSHGFCKKVTTKLKVGGALSSAASSDVKKTMRGQQDEVRALRDSCSNAMQLALRLHSEPRLFQSALLIERLSRPLTHWHMYWLHALRSRERPRL